MKHWHCWEKTEVPDRGWEHRPTLRGTVGMLVIAWRKCRCGRTQASVGHNFDSLRRELVWHDVPLDEYKEYDETYRSNKLASDLAKALEAPA